MILSFVKGFQPIGKRMITQIQELLQESLEELIDIDLPYAVECRKDQLEETNKLISDTKKALEYITAVTEKEVNDFMESNFVEGESILNFVLRMQVS